LSTTATASKGSVPNPPPHTGLPSADKHRQRFGYASRFRSRLLPVGGCSHGMTPSRTTNRATSQGGLAWPSWDAESSRSVRLGPLIALARVRGQLDTLDVVESTQPLRPIRGRHLGLFSQPMTGADAAAAVAVSTTRRLICILRLSFREGQQPAVGAPRGVTAALRRTRARRPGGPDGTGWNGMERAGTPHGYAAPSGSGGDARG
jgi:hypothetical protein